MRYIKPNSVKEAVDILSSEKGITRILAGGTDVLVQMKSGFLEPDTIVDIKNIPGIREISRKNDGYEIGAAVSGSELNDNLELKNFAPGISEAFSLIGSTQIQGRCTMVGNLCNASPAGDCIPALIASNAKVNVCGVNGSRVCNVSEIPIGPGKTSLKKGEFIKSIFIPSRPKFSSDAYLRFIPRTEMDIAIVSAGVFITIDQNDICQNVRIALGAVAPTVILAEEAGRLLIGSKLDEDALSKMSKKCSSLCKPIDDKRGTKEFRTHVSGVLAKRSALLAYNRAREGK